MSNTPLENWLKESEARLRRDDRPLVTLSYAQSLDGSITHRRGAPLALSGPESARMTHTLRSLHDAILVGVGTVLSDDPQLNVRHVPGKSPRPVVVDSHLRIPSTARIFSHSRQPIIASLTEMADTPQAKQLMRAGALLLFNPADGAGHVDLPALLGELMNHGISSIMVEGGAKIITSFISYNLVDRVVITIAPFFVGGLRSIETSLPELQRIKNFQSEHYANDLVVWGEL